MFVPLSYSSSFAADAHGTDRLTVLNLNQRKDPAGILPVVVVFFFFFTYLNSWTHHDNKQVNSVGHKIYCEAELKRKEGERMSCHGDVWNMTFVPEDIFRSDPFILQSI